MKKCLIAIVLVAMSTLTALGGGGASPYTLEGRDNDETSFGSSDLVFAPNGEVSGTYGLSYMMGGAHVTDNGTIEKPSSEPSALTPYKPGHAKIELLLRSSKTPGKTHRISGEIDSNHAGICVVTLTIDGGPERKCSTRIWR